MLNVPWRKVVVIFSFLCCSYIVLFRADMKQVLHKTGVLGRVVTTDTDQSVIFLTQISNNETDSAAVVAIADVASQTTEPLVKPEVEELRADTPDNLGEAEESAESLPPPDPIQSTDDEDGPEYDGLYVGEKYSPEVNNDQNVSGDESVSGNESVPEADDSILTAATDDHQSLSELPPNPSYELDPPKRKNVLFLMADDMRPQLGAYFGQDHPTPHYQRKMHTPNFDRLANQSMVFRRAYVQYSLCGPSRTSMLTSRRPDITRVFGNFHYWRVAGGNFTTLPQYFKNHGYKTIGVGKVFHPSISSNNSDPMSWTEQFYSVYTDMHYQNPNHLAGWRAVEPEARKVIPLTDEYAVQHTLSRLKDLAPEARTGEQPFFMALGFRKPHISLVCPKEYHELYPLETADQYLSDITWQRPHVAFRMENSTTIDNKHFLPDDFLRELRKAYFACISYVDDLLGVVLDEVESLGLMENTVISFVADHGYHLGENNHWGKYIPLEIANHVPMMIRVPGKTDQGSYTRSLVEALDMFPTVVDAAGLPPVPTCPRSSSAIAECTDGKSLMPVIEEPSTTVRGAAISQVLRGSQWTQYSMRTDRYRYIAHARTIHEAKPNGKYNLFYEWNPSDIPLELYDHQLDPEERFNRRNDTAYASVIIDLQARLEQRIAPIYDVPVKIP